MNEPEYNSCLARGSRLQGGKYIVERYLNSGGFGNTYLVRNIALQHPVVVKEFFLRGISSRGADSRTVTIIVAENRSVWEKQKRQFIKEARRIFALNHPNIVRVFDLFEENGTAYYVMDYIDGEALDKVVARQGALSEPIALGYIRQLLDALETVHAQGLYHLDVKPANLMVDRRGTVRLIDFGASKQLGGAESRMTTTTGMAYTPAYAAIEQQSGNRKAIGAWTDLYAVGATLYHLLTAQTPPSAVDLMNDTAGFRYPASVTPSTRDLIATLMQLSVKKRPQSVAEVRQLLGEPVKDDTSEVTTIAKPDAAPADAKTLYEEPTRPIKPSKSSPEPYPQAHAAKQSPKDYGKFSVKKRPQSVAEVRQLLGEPVKDDTSEVTTIAKPDAAPADAKTLYEEPTRPIKPSKSSPEPYPQAHAAKQSPKDYGKYVLACVCALMIIVLLILLPKECTSGSDETQETFASVSDVEEETYTVNGVSLTMIKVEGGSVKIDGAMKSVGSFSIGRTEVTQELWEAVMGYNPSFYANLSVENANLPVDNVSWDDCQVFIGKLNTMTGHTFRLPTEAEWEYAARGGNKTHNYEYSGSDDVDAVAWYYDNSRTGPHPVATKAPNELGIYDMSGNIWEWCQDLDGQGLDGSYHVNRGGSCHDGAVNCRVADRWSNRYSNPPDDSSRDLGLRLAL